MKKILNLMSLIFALAALSQVTIFAQDPQATAFLAKAKNAIGGEARINAVQSLSAEIKFRHAVPFPDVPEMTGELELNLLLPDKFLKAETIASPHGGSSTIIEALNGDQFWTDLQSTGLKEVEMFQIGTPDERGGRLRELRQDFARQLLLFLLTAPASLPLEWRYVGEANTQDGRADVLEAQGAEGFAARLFLDKQTGLPLMLSYRAQHAPMTIAVVVEDEQLGNSTIATPALEVATLHSEDASAHFSAIPLQEVEMQIRLSDYREVDGLRLPHRLTRAVNGQTAESWEVAGYTINPPLQAERFEQKRKK